MNKILSAIALSTLIVCAQAASNDADTAKTPSAGANPTAGQTAGKPAAGAASAASANQAGVNPRTAGGEQSKGPAKQMKKTEAQSNSSQ